MRDPDETPAAIDDVLTDWRGSQDAMTWTSNEPPPPTVEATKARWGWRTVKIMAFLYLWIAGTHLTTELIVGVWGGTPQDPLWLGAVSTGVGLAVGSVAAILGVTTIERIRNRPR